ncbi:hypothetical protein CRYUN_Cryun20dG0044100 [Craigia yunnanensis]
MLNIVQNFLTRQIPLSFGNCKSLYFLDLSSNNLTGLLLVEISISSLVVFNIRNALMNVGPFPFSTSEFVVLHDFSRNQFTGSILPFFISSYSLSVKPHYGFWLNGNNFEGKLFSDMGSTCKCLKILSLASNEFVGSLPTSFNNMVSLVKLNHSENRLQGPILSYIGVIKEMRATGCFNPQNYIGNEGFGAIYKAEITPGVMVAVKRLSVGRFQGVQQFDDEIKTCGGVQLPNLVTLIGYSVSEVEMFLINNYFPGGNLKKFIHERSKRTAE